MIILSILSALLSSDSNKGKSKKLTEKEKRELEYKAWEMSEEYDNDDF